MRDRQFNLLLSDIGLPDGTGIDLIREMRRHSTVPAIALTGFGMDQDISRYKEAGFDSPPDQTGKLPEIGNDYQSVLQR